MADVNCPYCKAGQEINHDDGYGYEEDVEHEQGCTGCGQNFRFTTSILYCYEALCDGDHDMENCSDIGFPDANKCQRCGHTEFLAAKSMLRARETSNE